METETVKTVKHTPLPWVNAPTGEVMHGYSQPFAIAQMDSKNLIAGLFGDVNGGEEAANANAEFIVRACNSHYEYLKCLKMIDECLSDGIPIEKNDPIHKVVKNLLTK